MTVPGFDAFDDRTTYPQALARRAEWHPDRPYLEDVAGRRLTFSAAHAQALTWADALRRLGVQQGDRVAVLMPPSFEAAMAWLGAAWLRAVEVPINTNYRGELLRYLLLDSGSCILIADARYADRLGTVLPGLPNLRVVVLIGTSEVAPDVGADAGVEVIAGEQFLAGAVPATGLDEPQIWDIAGVLYTGGTTGPSKGVVIPWGFYRIGCAILDDLTPDDAFYAPFPMFHGIGKVALMSMAYSGGRDVIREQFQTQYFWDDVDAHRCTFTVLLPTLFGWLLAQPKTPADRSHALRAVMGYGDLSSFKERFGVRIYNQWGMTEAGNPIGRRDVTDNWGSCGRVRPGYQVRIVDQRDFEVPVGEVGELIVRTERPWTVNLGYLGKPERTVEQWRNGWIHTGDAFRQDAGGNFYFVDRLRDYIRRRGENISSFEVEAIVRKHPAVVEVAAIGVPSEDGEDEVKICCVLAPDRQITPPELLEFLIPLMPRFMVPRYLEFVAQLPKTPSSGTVRKVELRANPLNEHTWDRVAAGRMVPR